MFSFWAVFSEAWPADKVCCLVSQPQDWRACAAFITQQSVWVSGRTGPSCATCALASLHPLCQHKDLCYVSICGGALWMVSDTALKMQRSSSSPAFVPRALGKKKRWQCWLHPPMLIRCHISSMQDGPEKCFFIICCISARLISKAFLTPEWGMQCEVFAGVGVGMGCSLSRVWKHNKGEPANKSGLITEQQACVQTKQASSLYLTFLQQVWECSVVLCLKSPDRVLPPLVQLNQNNGWYTVIVSTHHPEPCRTRL